MDTTLPFEQIFLRTLEDGGPEKFVVVWDESSPPTQQIGEAEWWIDTTEYFYTICGPWGYAMRQLIGEYEDAVVDALEAPQEAEPHLRAASQRLQRVYRTWKVMEEILLTDDVTAEREPYMSVCEQWCPRFKDYPTPGCNKVMRVEKYWQDVYPKLFVIAYYGASPRRYSVQERRMYALNLLSKFVECVYPRFMAVEPHYILDPNEGWPTTPTREEYQYCDLEAALWHFVGYLDDERQKALVPPEEVFKNLYDDWVPPKQFYQETLCVFP